MEPEIMPGDFIIAKEVDFKTIAIGDDVIYYSEAKNIFIVHRVIAIDEDGSLTMKGINNPVQDEEVVTIDNYIGKVVKHGSLFNLGNIVINKRFVLFAIIFIIFAILFITEMVKIVRTVKEKDKLRLEAEYENKLTEEIQKERERITAEIKEEIDKEK
ncbi:MAG: signal peptidase I [Bacilli bacterium]|nr:signal peptidase I [Bacilli bacterium]